MENLFPDKGDDLPGTASRRLFFVNREDGL
jgi:hypothetical protein